MTRRIRRGGKSKRPQETKPFVVYAKGWNSYIRYAFAGSHADATQLAEAARRHGYADPKIERNRKYTHDPNRV